MMITRIHRWLVMTALMMAMAVHALAGKVYTPADMPNVNVANRYEFVSDPAGLLPAEVKKTVNERLWNLRQQTSVEAVVALPPDIGDTPIEEWSEQLFTSWGIGKKDRDNGVLLVIAPEQRKVRIQTGYGTEGALPDISCANIINTAVVPNMREGNLGAAVNDATQLICSALTDPAVAEELRSKEADNYSGVSEALDGEVIVTFIKYVALGIFLVGLFLFFRDVAQAKGKDQYHKAMLWRSHLTTYLLCGVLSLGAGLIFWMLAYWLYRSNRTGRHSCPNCGTRMKRLNEEDDNALLTPSQDFEEQLKTVDYDVWECPQCGTVERYPYKEKQMKYTECPACHTVAMCLTSDKTVKPATRYAAGVGEKTYECKFCHHERHDRYVIPKRTSEDAALVAGAVLGSMAGRGRGGGGFGGGGFGGGFGGGSTGGGGASGGW